VVEFADLIQQGLSSPDALVRETAQLAAYRAFEPEAYHIVPASYMNQNPNLNQPRQAQQEWQWPAWEQEGGIVMPITTMERILLLRRVELFKEIPAQELELIARLCSVVHFAPGECFISQGERSDGLYILVAGEVEVSTDDLGIIDMRKEGDVIGEIGVLANQVRSANCTAVVETTALHIRQADLWDLLERNATLSASVIRVLVPKLLSYSEKLYSSKNGLDYQQVGNMPYSSKGDFMGNSAAR
jgi:hypothetical protein